jgi:hypothetical protein
LEHFRKCKDTLQDLYFRITTGQTPIVQTKDLPEDVCQNVRRYEGNRRAACLKSLEEAWGSDWQEHLPLPKTAIGISKLRVLATLAKSCKDLGEDLEYARQFIDAEIAKRELASDPDSSQSDSSKSDSSQSKTLVSRKEIEAATEAMETEAARIEAEAARLQPGQQGNQSGGSGAQPMDDEEEEARQERERRAIEEEAARAKAGESSKKAAGDGPSGAHANKAKQKGKRPNKSPVSVCPDVASPKSSLNRSCSCHRKRRKISRRNRNTLNHCGNVEKNMDPEDHQSFEVSQATWTPSVNVFATNGKPRFEGFLPITWLMRAKRLIRIDSKRSVGASLSVYVMPTPSYKALFRSLTGLSIRYLSPSKTY